MYEYLTIHRLSLPYSFMDKKGKIKVGTIIKCEINCEQVDGIRLDNVILYHCTVEGEDKTYLIDHYTNREI